MDANKIADDLKKWFNKPFDAQGDVVAWILFLGFVIAVSFMWTRVLKQIRE